jgi:elongation of very long chain fatty acids protein 4
MIIIAKGNYRQLSFLHVFHHSSVSTIMYYNYKLIPYGGDTWFLLFYNSFIHVVLYYYYFITSFKSNTKVWWSKYLTTFQIIQFLFGNIQQAGSIIVRKDYPKYIREANFLYSSYMLYLFVSFYIKRYNKIERLT